MYLTWNDDVTLVLYFFLAKDLLSLSLSLSLYIYIYIYIYILRFFRCMTRNRIRSRYNLSRIYHYETCNDIEILSSKKLENELTATRESSYRDG